MDARPPLTESPEIVSVALPVLLMVIVASRLAPRLTSPKARLPETLTMRVWVVVPEPPVPEGLVGDPPPPPHAAVTRAAATIHAILGVIASSVCGGREAPARCLTRLCGTRSPSGRAQ